ncbi:glycosyltransferase [Mesomycoplasma moatsii]|uniref:glycosyltransferase n=1 Tax=Mesomycoplasma moatsii TaxID=171287 RepID=UPI0003FC7BD3
MLYTTCNDFDQQSLIKSAQQNYENYDVYILDDSYDKKYIKQIDEFVKKYKDKFKLIRRENREGFKAGNINNFLKNYDLEYDYFVLLDSDEIIPNNFISETLKYFVDEKIGIVQANHKGTRGQNLFDSIGELGIYPAWTAFIKVKNEYGVVTLNGHGAIISRKCYEDTNGFPPLVAEDLAFTINLMNKGYRVLFAEDVICEEVFPIDYLAFKKRSIKWTQGNIQFFKVMWLKMLKLNISFFKKIDLWLSTTSLSLSVFSIFVVIINFSILYPLGFKYSHLYILLVFMIVFLITPFINDFIFLVNKIKFWKLLSYILFCLMLYTSMIVCSIKTLILTLLGKKRSL